MKIILARHGKPNLEHWAWITPWQMKEWIQTYDQADIILDEVPPETMLTAASSGIVVTSTSQRSVQSAQCLNKSRAFLTEAVSDLTAAKQWYAQILGISPYFDESFYVGFSVGGFELGLIPDGEPGVAGPQPLWGVSDAARTFARLVELGASPLDPVAEVGGGIKVGAVTDPFGNRFGIIENPHFDTASVR